MLNTSQLLRIFNWFNHEYFDSELPEPKFEYKYVKGFIGQFHAEKSYAYTNDCIIRISSAWELTDFEVEKVIIHEMVHEWQWVHNHQAGHGMWFKLKAAEINERTNNRYHISRLTSISHNKCMKDKDKPAYNGVVFTFKNAKFPGKMLIARCSKESQSSFASWLPKAPHISEVNFYIAKGHYFNTLPKSISRVNGTFITPDFFEKFIKPCCVKQIGK